MIQCRSSEIQSFIRQQIQLDEAGMLPITMYASGLQASPTDLLAVGDSQTWSAGAQSVTPHWDGNAYRFRPISARVLRMLADHANQDRSVFLDSGAFSAFSASIRHQRAVPAVPWHQVFESYEQLVAEVSTTTRLRLTLVAPDVVGDAAATTQLWNRYAAKLRSLARSGARIIFPLQRADTVLLGDLISAAADSWRHAQAIAGANAVAGFPFSKRAWSLDEVQDLCCQVDVPRAHLLGLGSASKINQVLCFLERTLPEDRFPDLSADAAIVRSMVGTTTNPTVIGKRIAVRTFTIASEQVSYDDDEAMIYDHLDASRAQARREVLAEALSLPLGPYQHYEPICYREAVLELVPDTGTVMTAA